MVVETLDAVTEERGENDAIWGSMIKQAIKRRHPGIQRARLRIPVVQRSAGGCPETRACSRCGRTRSRAATRCAPQTGLPRADAAPARRPAAPLNSGAAALTHLAVDPDEWTGMPMISRRRHTWMWAEACALLDEAERRHRHFFELLAAPSASARLGAARQYFRRRVRDARHRGAARRARRGRRVCRSPLGTADRDTVAPPQLRCRRAMSFAWKYPTAACAGASICRPGRYALPERRLEAAVCTCASRGQRHECERDESESCGPPCRRTC